nr:Leucine-rich repeat protein [Ipomoea batatas]GMD11347.1 Leucine-rich repeat protein [Ipomoea batatas]
MYSQNLALQKILPYCLIFSLILQHCGADLLPLPPLPLIPVLPPLIPDLLNFLDDRIVQLLPVILNFKNSILSDPLGITLSWAGPNVCKYKGFYCDHPPDNKSATALASIDFNGFQLSAPSLDGFIDQLPDLAIFHANSNNFSGTISPKIANLPFLYELDLSNNKFSGAFPTSILNLMDLSFLDIRFNSLSGAVPPQIFGKRLDALFLNNNNFMQTLPDNLGSTTAAFLTLANNRFTGPIPRSVGNASATLLEVLFLNNKLTGCIPVELGLLRRATVIDVGGNALTGPLPCSLGCLDMAEQLNFAGNLLYGSVPEPLCGLGNLQNLSLSYNYFTKVGAACRKLITAGILDVKQNCIPGLPNQRSAADCAAFSRTQQQCPNRASYNRIPCKNPKFSQTVPESNKPRSERHLITYSALLRHGL